MGASQASQHSLTRAVVAQAKAAEADLVGERQAVA